MASEQKFFARVAQTPRSTTSRRSERVPFVETGEFRWSLLVARLTCELVLVAFAGSGRFAG